MTISVAQFIVKITLSVLLINIAIFGVQWGMGALALSTSIARTLEAVVLFILLSQRVGGFEMSAYARFFGRAFLASGVMAVLLIVVRSGLDYVIDTTSMTRLFLPDIFRP